MHWQLQGRPVEWVGLMSLLLLPFLLGSVARAGDAVQADSESARAAALLERMGDALRRLDYEGTMVQLHGHNVETLHVLHDGPGDDPEGVERERVSSLNGKARELVRLGEDTLCFTPDSNKVERNQAPPTRWSESSIDAYGSSGHYQLKLLGLDRVAGRMADVVDVRPGDRFRYGHRFWVDRESGLMLRTLLLSPGGEVLEQLVLTSLNIYPELDSSRFELPLPLRDRLAALDRIPSVEEPQTWLPQQSNALLDADVLALRPHSGQSSLSFSEALPPGFNVISEFHYQVSTDHPETEQVVLSDGVATLSVYFERRPNAVSRRALVREGVSSMGSINAMVRQDQSVRLTVVGQVPADTVKAVAEAALWD